MTRRPLPPAGRSSASAEAKRWATAHTSTRIAASDLPRARKLLLGSPERWFAAESISDDRLIATLHLKHGYTQAQIADHLGLHYATVSRIVSRQDRTRNKT